jgi:hypothetical protein
VSAIASVGTFVVIAATAVAAFVQLRHMRGSNSITALTECREVLESEEFDAAQRFIAYNLQELLKDESVRRELTRTPISERLRAINVVGNFFESLGSFVRHGIIDQEIACSLWCGITVQNWKALSPALAIMRRSAGPALWEQFEYFASISKEYVDRHGDGDYPPGVKHMPIEDVWLEADRAAEQRRVSS